MAALSEIGVVLLLFEIGLELSLSNVLRWGRSVLVAGGAQVAGMLALAAAAGTALDLPIGQVLFYGALAAMSSTAAVTKLYADRGELDTPHGRETVSVLLFQDLCIVPLMALLPLLAAAGAGPGLPAFWTQLLLSLGAMAALVVGGRLAVRWTLDRVVAQRHRDLFTLCVGFFAIGTALVSAAAGFSLAIGAFLAGLIISESEYGQQALSDVIPFRVLFSGVFFTSIGMLLDVSLLVQRPFVVVGAALLIVAVKTVVATGAILLRGRPLDIGSAERPGSGPGRGVLVRAGRGRAAAGPVRRQRLPDLPVGGRALADGDAVSHRVGPRRGRGGCDAARRRGAARARPARGARGRFGRRRLPRPRRRHRLRPGGTLPRAHAAGGGDSLRRHRSEPGARAPGARTDGLPAVYGDGTRHALLERVAGAHARIIVFAIPSSMEERRGVAAARELAPAARIVVRTRYVRAIDELRRLGADAVVVEEFEASLELFKRALEGYEIPAGRIAHELDAVRSEHYGLLRGTAAPDLTLDALQHLGIHDALELVEVEAGSPAIGENARTLDLRRRTAAIQVAVVRNGAPIWRRDDAFRYVEGDTAVLVGDREALDAASALFRAGASTPHPQR